MREIKLCKVLKVDSSEYGEWSLCFNNANYDGLTYTFAKNGARLLEHIGWKKCADHKHSFRVLDKKYCLQFLRLDKEDKKDEWLFLGAFERDGLNTYPNGDQVYSLDPMQRFEEFKERLIVRFKKIQGPNQAKVHISEIENIEVVEILKKPYCTYGRR